MVIRTNLNNALLQNGSSSLLGLYSVEIGTFTEVVQIQYLDMTKNTKVSSINFDTGDTLEKSRGHNNCITAEYENTSKFIES